MISINKSRIRSLKAHLPSNLLNKGLSLAVEFEPNANKARRVGFTDAPEAGDTILPKPVGPITRFNAHGREEIRRDQPKETLYRTQQWTHEEWRGKGETETVTSLVDVRYYRYPREAIDGYGLELTIREQSGKLLICLNGDLTYTDEDPRLLAAINIFLEIFGYVEVFDEALGEIMSAGQLRRLNWVVLPKGEKFTEEALKEVLSKSKRIRPVEMLRQERISAFGPDIRAIGSAGFTGYVIYVFRKKHIAVLESIRYGNASYVIADDNWENLSKMTKQQLLAKSLVETREIHNKSWFDRIQQILK